MSIERQCTLWLGQPRLILTGWLPNWERAALRACLRKYFVMFCVFFSFLPGVYVEIFKLEASFLCPVYSTNFMS